MKKYDTYKDSGIEWIGEIPEHWEMKRLNYLGEVQTGRTPKIQNSKIDYFENGIINWYTPSDFTNNNKLKESQRKVISEAVKLGEVELFPKESVYLISIGATLGRVGFSIEKASANQQINIITFNDLVVPKFGFYYLLGNKEMINMEADHTTLPILNQSKTKNLYLSRPPIEEQTAIASYLDQKTAEIDQLIADKKNLLELYEEEKIALINDLVTGKRIYDGNTWTKPKQVKNSSIDWLGEIPSHWEVKRFKYYFDLINIKTDENLKKIGLENVESKTGRFVETDSDFAGQGVRFQIKDILFGKLRPYLAKVWLAEFDGHAVGDFYVFRAKPSVYPSFAKYRLLDSSFIQITNSSTYGSKMPRVNWEFIANLQIAFPKDIEEQKTIVNFIESESKRLETKIQDTQKLIELLKEYKEALISELVTGKVKVV